MNIFILSESPIEAAQLQCNAHSVKMVLESAQMLSTAHRMLDGYTERNLSKSGKRMVDHWIHPDPQMDKVLYKAVHFNHPCTVWSMKTDSNYKWHYEHFVALCDEYTYRYGKVHLAETKLKEVLAQLPRNIPKGPLTPQPLAMGSNPECMNPNDVVGSYRAFYQTKQERFKMVWTRRPVPEWFKFKETELSV
jgi:hypothetical protein